MVENSAGICRQHIWRKSELATLYWLLAPIALALAIFSLSVRAGLELVGLLATGFFGLSSTWQ